MKAPTEPLDDSLEIHTGVTFTNKNKVRKGQDYQIGKKSQMTREDYSRLRTIDPI